MDFDSTRADASGGETSGEIRPVGEPTDAQLEAINKHARSPLKKSDVYVYQLEISNDRYDSYRTRMDPDSTLKNYRADFAEGRPLQNSHNNYELPLGRSFAASMEEREKPKRTAVVVNGYITRGVKLGSVAADDVIRAIDSGQVKDASVRFDQNAEYWCDLCDKSMDRYPMFMDGSRDVEEEDEPCHHLIGVRYGTKMATATIKNAHAVEHSLVFKGSNPATQVDRARALLKAGKLTQRQVREFEQYANVRMDGVEGSQLAIEDIDTERAAATARVEEHFKDLDEDLRKIAVRWYFRAGKSKAKYAMANGSYPINNCSDVSDAAKLAHHSKTYSFEQVKAHVYKAKSALGCPDSVIPDSWKADSKSSEKSEHTIGGMRLDAKTFIDLLGTISEKDDGPSRAALAVIDHMGDEVTVDYARSAAKEFVLRYGKKISADTESVISAALDKLESPEDSKAAAIAALKGLVGAKAATQDIIPEKGQPDLNKGDDDAADGEDESTAGKKKPKAKSGQVGRSEDDGERAKKEPAEDGSIDENNGSPTGKEAGQSEKGKEDEEEDNDASAKKARAKSGDPDKGEDADGDHDALEDGKEAVSEEQRKKKRAKKDGADAEDVAQDNADDNDPDRSQAIDVSKLNGAAANVRILSILLSDDTDDKAVGARAQVSNAIRGEEFAQLRRFVAEAREGRRYRGALVQELHEWGVRAKGDGYNRSMYDRLTSAMSVEEITALASDYRDQAITRFEQKPKGDDLPDWAKRELRPLGERVGGRQTEANPTHKRSTAVEPVQTVGDLRRQDVSEFKQPDAPHIG